MGGSGSGLFPPTKLVYQFQDALADLEQLLACGGDGLFRQKFSRRDGFESGLRLVGCPSARFKHATVNPATDVSRA